MITSGWMWRRVCRMRTEVRTRSRHEAAPSTTSRFYTPAAIETAKRHFRLSPREDSKHTTTTICRSSAVRPTNRRVGRPRACRTLNQRRRTHSRSRDHQRRRIHNLRLRDSRCRRPRRAHQKERSRRTPRPSHLRRPHTRTRTRHPPQTSARPLPNRPLTPCPSRTTPLPARTILKHNARIT